MPHYNDVGRGQSEMHRSPAAQVDAAPRASPPMGA